MDASARHVKATLSPEQAAEMQAVDGLAEKLLAHIVATSAEIADPHVHGAKSKAIRDHFVILLREELCFGEEVLLTPQSGLVTRARPDFFFELANGRGTIAVVERGGTTTNNHDSKDLWKAHVAPDAHHLSRASRSTIGRSTALRGSVPSRGPPAGSGHSSAIPVARSTC